VVASGDVSEWMSDAPPTRITTAAEAWKTLYLPILLGILAIVLIVYDNIIDPPGAIQGTSGVALALISISLGLGFDITRKSDK
jgi:hypothetical protein